MTTIEFDTPPELMDALARDFVALTVADIERAARCDKPEWMLADMAFCYWLESKVDRARPRKSGDGGSAIDIDGVEIDVRWAKNPTHLLTFSKARLADLLVLVGSYDSHVHALLGYITREEHVRRKAETLTTKKGDFIVKRTPVGDLKRMRDLPYDLIG